MTYDQLRKAMNDMSEEQLQQDVTVYVDGEYYASCLIFIDDNFLDFNHPFLRAN